MQKRCCHLGPLVGTPQAGSVAGIDGKPAKRHHGLEVEITGLEITARKLDLAMTVESGRTKWGRGFMAF